MRIPTDSGPFVQVSESTSFKSCLISSVLLFKSLVTARSLQLTEFCATSKFGELMFPHTPTLRSCDLVIVNLDLGDFGEARPVVFKSGELS